MGREVEVGGTNIIHSEFVGSDCSRGRGSHMSSVWRRVGGSPYVIEGMCFGYSGDVLVEDIGARGLEESGGWRGEAWGG